MHQDNEINLYDLWFTITKRKVLFWGVFTVFLVISITITLSKPRTYEYTQTLQIANYMDNKGKILYAEPTETIIAKIKQVYLPTILKTYNTQHPDKSIYLNAANLVAKTTSKSSIDGTIILKIKGQIKKQPFYTYLFNELLKQTNKDTMPIIQQQKDFLDNELTRLKKQLTTQMDSDKQLVNTKPNATIVQAGTLALMRNQQVQLINHITSIEQAKIMTKNTQFTSDFIRSLTPVGASRSILGILSLIMAFILGLLAVFIAEFFAKLRLLKEAEVNHSRK